MLRYFEILKAIVITMNADLLGVKVTPQPIKRPTSLCPHKLETLANMKRKLGLPQSHSFVRDGYPGAPRRRRNLSKHPLYHNHN